MRACLLARAFEPCNSTVRRIASSRLPGALGFVDARLQLHAKLLPFAAPHALQALPSPPRARLFAILVQHGLRQQVLVGLLQAAFTSSKVSGRRPSSSGEDRLEDPPRSAACRQSRSALQSDQIFAAPSASVSRAFSSIRSSCRSATCRPLDGVLDRARTAALRK